MDPDDRADLVAAVDAMVARVGPHDKLLVADALERLSGASEGVRGLLRGRHATGELRRTLQALSRAVCDLSSRLAQRLEEQAKGVGRFTRPGVVGLLVEDGGDVSGIHELL